MFGADGGDKEQGPQPPPRPEMPPKKAFRVQRFNPISSQWDTFTIEAHFMAPLDRGQMAFNVYDFETPQGVSTIRVLSSYFDIEQLETVRPSGIIH